MIVYRYLFAFLAVVSYSQMFCVTVTGLEPLGGPTFSDVAFTNGSLSWCGDCEYLAVCSNLISTSQGSIEVYRLDEELNALSFVTAVTLDENIDLSANAWCGDCEYIAVVGTDNNSGLRFMQVYSFDKDASELSFISSKTFGEDIVCNSIAWCGDCEYIALGGATASEGLIQLYSFDKGTGTLTAVTSATPELIIFFNSVSWCGNCQYIAACGYDYDASVGLIQIYQFDKNTDKLSLITTKTLAEPSSSLYSISWCGDCQYIAVCGLYTDGGLDHSLVKIYSFNEDAGSLTLITSLVSEVLTEASAFYSASWCGDCKYLALGGYSGTFGLTQVYNFNTVLGTLILIASESTSVGKVQTLAWCGACDYLATNVSNESPASAAIQLFKATKISAPTLHAQKSSYRFPTQLDILNTLCWDAATNAVSYNVYADINKTVLLAQLTNAPYCYSQHQIIPGAQKTYYVTSVSANGIESEINSVTI